MLCIKKNKCFSTVLLLSQKNRQHTVIRSDLLKHVWTCRNTFQSVQINPFEPVETRFNPFRSVQTRFQASPPPLLHPPSPFSPLLPLFPFLGGGREGEHYHGPPEGGGGGRSPPPPPQDFNNNNKKQNSLTLSSLCCVIYPYPLEVSLSVHCCCCSKLHKHLWWRPLNKIHCGILQYLYLYIFIIYPPLNKYLIFSFSKKKFLLSVVDARWWSNGVNLNSFFLSQSFFFKICVILFNEI